MRECIDCWWQEGGRCYEGEPETTPDGRSTIMAEELCEKFLGKRAMLSRVIPNDKLVIVSEFNIGTVV